MMPTRDDPIKLLVIDDEPSWATPAEDCRLVLEPNVQSLKELGAALERSAADAVVIPTVPGKLLRGVLRRLRAGQSPVGRLTPLRRMLRNRPLILVVDSVDGQSALLEQTLDHPDIDFIRHPVDRAELYQRAGRLVRRSRLQESGSQSGGAAARPAARPLFDHLVPDLHDPDSGRLDAKRIAFLFGVPVALLARAIGREASTVHKTPDAPALQAALAIYERIAAALRQLTRSDASLRSWLQTANPDLEDQTPLALLLAGRGEVVAELLEDALLGQPG